MKQFRLTKVVFSNSSAPILYPVVYTLSVFLVEIDNLTRLCEKSNSKSNGNGESFGELSKQKQALQRERDALIEESTRLRSDMTNAEDRINGLEKESAEGKTVLLRLIGPSH